jgi:hypothetical protein
MVENGAERDPQREHEVVRAGSAAALDRDRADGSWADANVAAIDSFNWYESGPRPVARVRTLYDARALYLCYEVPDERIESQVTELNGAVHTDSCVEFFCRPRPERDERYLNFEANPCGVFKLGWQEPGWQAHGERDLISPDLAAGIEIATSEAGPTREPRPDDESWWLAVALPFEILAAFTGLDLSPEAGTTWPANVHRTGVASESQEASWNPIDTPEKDFHSPGHFGRLVFR